MTSALALETLGAGDLITADDQIEWRGLLLGAGTPFRWTGLEGWLDSPDTRGSDSDRTDRHGSLPGSLLAQSRTITYSWQMKGVSLGDFPAQVARLRRATTIARNGDEEPLVIRRHGVTHMVMARCTNRAIPDDAQYWRGIPRGAIRWRASNPELLQLPRLDVSIGLAAPAVSGLAFPLAFPLDFGAGRPDGGEFTITNEGDSEAWPVWRITGPITGPAITNPDTGDTLAFDPAWALPAGQTLEIDTDARTVLITDSLGNSTSVSRSDRLFVRQWFPLPPGQPTRVRFTAVSGYASAARLRCLAYHTSL